jgi:DNA-binding response OmpR family regulator
LVQFADIPGDMLGPGKPPEDKPMARLLVVDDEAILRVSMAEVLRRKGYQVDEAADGREALTLVQVGVYDLMVLDLVMPDLSGVEVMRLAGRLCPSLSIIVLTAHAAVDSAIAAVRANVADYMLKPCNVEDLAVAISRELQERARRLRRERLLSMVSETVMALNESEALADPAPASPSPSARPVPSHDLICTGPLTLDRQKRLATVDGDPARTVELTDGEASILIALMERPNQVFSCGQLASTALGYEGMDKWTVESVVRSSVFRLRRKIEPAPDAPRLICTVRGRGYYFSPA